MKKITNIFVVLLAVVLFSGCCDRSVLDDKGLNYYMPMPENVQYTMAGDKMILTWDFPEIPAEYQTPVAVSIQKVENNVYRDVVTLTAGETTTKDFKDDNGIFTRAADKTYRFIVKLRGTFKPEFQEKGRTSTVTSDGVVVNIE